MCVCISRVGFSVMETDVVYKGLSKICKINL